MIIKWIANSQERDKFHNTSQKSISFCLQVSAAGNLNKKFYLFKEHPKNTLKKFLQRNKCMIATHWPRKCYCQ